MDLNKTLLQAIDNEPENIKSIQTLLDQPGISVNFKHPHDHQTALHIATRHGLPVVVEMLLLYGSHVNVTTLDLVTPLHEACLIGDVECTKFLIQAGAGVS